MSACSPPDPARAAVATSISPVSASTVSASARLGSPTTLPPSPSPPPPPRPPRTCGSLEYALGASRGRERTCRERRRASPRRAPRCSPVTSATPSLAPLPSSLREVSRELFPSTCARRPARRSSLRVGNEPARARRAGATAHRSRAASTPPPSSCRSNNYRGGPRARWRGGGWGWGAPSFAPARGRESHSDEPRIIASGSLFGGVDIGSVPPPLARGPVCAREGDGSSEGSFASRAPTTEKSRAR